MVARINADILLPNYELYIMRIHVRISLWLCLKRRRTHGGFLLKLEWPLKSICRLPVISHLLSNYPTIWNIGPDSNPPPMLQGCREIRHPFTTLTVESPSVSPMEERRFCFIPDGFFPCPGIGAFFSFSDITIVEDKSSADYFRLFRLPFPCTGYGTAFPR